ncbi:hypothetical protein OF83DRAFT_1089304 [Amylostereum chailletii]|nr:hypothetical protein OF83DRAFT_1089304 [Amylostereum chailletii]
MAETRNISQEEVDHAAAIIYASPKHIIISEDSFLKTAEWHFSNCNAAPHSEWRTYALMNHLLSPISSTFIREDAALAINPQGDLEYYADEGKANGGDEDGENARQQGGVILRRIPDWTAYLVYLRKPRYQKPKDTTRYSLLQPTLYFWQEDKALGPSLEDHWDSDQARISTRVTQIFQVQRPDAWCAMVR